MKRLALPPALLALVAGALLMLAGPSAASAKTHVTIGVGDETPSMFSDSNFKKLHLHNVRYFIGWDAAKHPEQLATADAYVKNARKAHVHVLMHISTNDYTPKKAHLPSVSEYKKYVGKLVKRYKKLGVKDWGTWNEENNSTEPTYKSPRRAAQFFTTMRSLCHGCKIVALDLLDSSNSSKYVASFYKALSHSNRKRANLVGIHNYADVNYERSTGTRRIFKAVDKANPSAKYYFTETGGLVRLGNRGGKDKFPCSPNRAASRLKYMFKLAKKYRHDVSRLYIYNFYSTGCGFFDAGLVNTSTGPLKGYTVVKDALKGFLH